VFFCACSWIVNFKKIFIVHKLNRDLSTLYLTNLILQSFSEMFNAFTQGKNIEKHKIVKLNFIEIVLFK
jgi:hypothetical protein